MRLVPVRAVGWFRAEPLYIDWSHPARVCCLCATLLDHLWNLDSVVRSPLTHPAPKSYFLSFRPSALDGLTTRTRPPRRRRLLCWSDDNLTKLEIEVSETGFRTCPPCLPRRRFREGSRTNEGVVIRTILCGRRDANTHDGKSTMLHMVRHLTASRPLSSDEHVQQPLCRTGRGRPIDMHDQVTSLDCGIEAIDKDDSNHMMAVSNGVERHQECLLEMG